MSRNVKSFGQFNESIIEGPEKSNTRDITTPRPVVQPAPQPRMPYTAKPRTPYTAQPKNTTQPSQNSDILNSLLKELETQLKDSKSMSMSYDDREMVYRDGFENGLQQSIDLIKEYILKSDIK